MADVTGPISTLPGAVHSCPTGTMCDEHPDRPAVRRIQGETDSFGSEMHDLCQECVDAMKAHAESEEGKREMADWRTGNCEWCRKPATDLRDARDYEEGMNGPVYRVCGDCIKRRNDRAEYDDGYYD